MVVTALTCAQRSMTNKYDLDAVSTTSPYISLSAPSQRDLFGDKFEGNGSENNLQYRWC